MFFCALSFTKGFYGHFGGAALWLSRKSQRHGENPLPNSREADFLRVTHLGASAAPRLTVYARIKTSDTSL